MHVRRWTVVIIICLVISALLTGYKILQIRSAMAFARSLPERSETVGSTIVKTMQWRPSVKVMGEVRPPQSLALRNELEGKIVTVGFEPGAMVKKGQLLIQLDISHELAQLKAAQAQAQLAQLELDRYRRLSKKKVISKEQFDKARAQSTVALAGVQLLHSTINKKTLTAPFDAYAGLHELEAGQYLPVNTLLTHLVGVSTDIWIDFYLPQSRTTLMPGAKVTVYAPERLKKTATGVVLARDSLVSSQSRNLRFRALFKQLAGQLQPGETVEVTIPAAQADTVVAVPMTALVRDNFGAYLYVLLPDKTANHFRAQKRPVALGPAYKNTIIITNGIKAGVRIATDGAHKLRNNMLVKLNPAHPGGGAPVSTGSDHE